MSKQAKQNRRVPEMTLTFEDVISSYMIRGLTSWEDVAKLGSNNVAVLISHARSREKGFTAHVAQLKEQQKLFLGKTGDDFKKLGEQYENPEFPRIGVLPDSYGSDPEPLDAASKARERGATTFNVCGWCKHSGGGSGRFNYMITTNCNLLGGYPQSPNGRFDTPCMLKALTAEKCSAQVDRIQKEVDESLLKREKVRAGIKLLQRLKKGQPEKPYLTSLRSHQMFNAGDKAMAYIGQWNSGQHKVVANGKWIPVTIVPGYRYHDGCVSAQAEFPIHSNMAYDGGCGYGIGDSHPGILSESEFDWLRKAATDGDLGFLGLWIANIDDHYKGFDRLQYLRDLTGDIATPPTN